MINGNVQASPMPQNIQNNNVMINRSQSMPIQNNPQNTNLTQTKTFSNTNESPGFFSNLFSKIKDYFVIEEEEYIDAHGFKAKRPKKKIPLRKEEEAMGSQAKLDGTAALSTASQYSPFGRMFL